jgi:hypothetical protein
VRGCGVGIKLGDVKNLSNSLDGREGVGIDDGGQKSPVNQNRMSFNNTVSTEPGQSAIAETKEQGFLSGGHGG